MAQNNIGSLVVLKPGQQQLIAGIFTERGIVLHIIKQSSWKTLEKGGLDTGVVQNKTLLRREFSALFVDV